MSSKRMPSTSTSGESVTRFRESGGYDPPAAARPVRGALSTARWHPGETVPGPGEAALPAVNQSTLNRSVVV
jgi:hypothetical protein